MRLSESVSFAPIRRWLVMLACGSVGPLVVLACSKPAPAVVDAAPPPPTVLETPDTGPLVLEPLVEDAGPDAEPDAAKKPTGPVLTTNQSRAKQCCNAMRSQAKSLGASPEANILTAFAVQCDAFAMQISPTAGAQAPELAPLRTFLKGKTVPAICQGL